MFKATQGLKSKGKIWSLSALPLSVIPHTRQQVLKVLVSQKPTFIFAKIVFINLSEELES